MAFEIERKFLVKQIPVWYEQFPQKKILQGYFNDATTGKSIRLRKMDDVYIITRKKWTGLVKEEKETVISKEEFNALRPNVENHFLKKTRYFIPYEGETIEFDIYEELQGLMTAEVEFKTKRDAKKFMKPDRFDEELTLVREASNSYIAKYGIDGELLTLLQS